MKKIMNSNILCYVYTFIKSVLMVGIALALIYSFLFLPVMGQTGRITCHNNTLAEARAFGQNIFEQNKDLEGVNEDELTQQVNSLIGQQYETSFALCLRSKGL